MFPPEVITKLGLIDAGKSGEHQVMYSSFLGLYLLECDKAGDKLPDNVYMVKRTINGITHYSYTNRVRILTGQDLSAHLN